MTNNKSQTNMGGPPPARAGGAQVGKILSGVVVSDKMKDTVVVKVIRFVKHSKYKKYFKVAKKYKAHNPGNTVRTGDKVSIKETRPISKDKHFIVMS